MPTFLFLALLSLTWPALMIAVDLGAEATHLEMPISAGAVLKLAIYIVSALAISDVFVRRERRAFSFGEQSFVALPCLVWALALDYDRILFLSNLAGESLGFHGSAGVLGMAVALNLVMVHVAFGVIAPRFVVMRLKTLGCDSS